MRVLGLGGPAMEKAGVEIVVPQRELAVGGLGIELLRDLHRIVGAWRRMTRALARSAARPRDPRGFAGLQPAVRAAREARRRAGALLREPAGVGVAARPGPEDRAARGSARGDLPVRAGGLRRARACAVDFVGHPLVDRARAARRRERTRAPRGARSASTNRARWWCCCPAAGATRSAPRCRSSSPPRRRCTRAIPRVGFARGGGAVDRSRRHRRGHRGDEPAGAARPHRRRGPHARRDPRRRRGAGEARHRDARGRVARHAARGDRARATASPPS